MMTKAKPESRREELAKTGAGPQTGKDGTTVAPTASGLGYNGEFKVGKITLAMANGRLRLRKENEGSEVETDEATVGGILDDHFFTKKIGKDGNVKTKGT